LTNEQQEVIKAIANHKMVKVIARAGCGKTHSALAVVDYYSPNKGLYFAFNKAIVVEGNSKFPPNIECRTIHALALKYSGLKVGTFSYHNIHEKLQYLDKRAIITTIDKFCNSGSLDPYRYCTDEIGGKLGSIASGYIELMVEGDIPASFGVILKYFHLMLAEEELVLGYDLIILDEAGDTTEVILEVFKLLNSPKKLMLGDPYQNIYTFTHTIDGFNYLKDKGIELELSNSYRVSPDIAEYIQAFSRKYIDEEFNFKGLNTGFENNTECYITRTNARLIQVMQDLCDSGVDSFNSIRSIDDIFELVLTIITISAGTTIKGKSYAKYKYLVDEYNSFTRYKGSKTTYLAWLASQLGHDVQIKSAVRTIGNTVSSKVNLFDLKSKFVKMNSKKSNIYLGTAFVTKGLEFDTVHIEQDLHDNILKIIEEDTHTDNQYTELLLYYVACSRAKYTLNGRVELE